MAFSGRGLSELPITAYTFVSSPFAQKFRGRFDSLTRKEIVNFGSSNFFTSPGGVKGKVWDPSHRIPCRFTQLFQERQMLVRQDLQELMQMLPEATGSLNDSVVRSPVDEWVLALGVVGRILR